MRFVLILLALMGLTVVAQAASLSQAERLYRLGFYASALTSYQSLSAQEVPQGVEGLMRAALANQKPMVVLETVEAAKDIKPTTKAFFTMLAQLQLGNFQAAQRASTQVVVEELGSDDQVWAQLGLGLIDYLDGKIELAEGHWKTLSGMSAQLAYTLQGGTSIQLSPAVALNIEKRLKRWNKSDWPLVKLNLLGLAKVGQAAKAKELLAKNISRCPEEGRLLLASLSTVGSLERREQLIALLKQTKDPLLRAAALKLACVDTSFTQVELQEIIGEAASDARLGLVLVEAWRAHGDNVQAGKLLEKISAAGLADDWLALLNSYRAVIAWEAEAPRYRDAADALLRLCAMSIVGDAEREELQGQVADAYFKNGDWADAAKAYEQYKATAATERSRRHYQAVLAWLKAEKPEEAKRVLAEKFGAWPQAMLAYVMAQEAKGITAQESLAAFKDRPMSDEERWSLDYLTVSDAARTSKPEALELVTKILDKVPAEASWRVYFELQKYDLLKALKRDTDAADMLAFKLKQTPPNTEFVKRSIEEALYNKKSAQALELLRSLQGLTSLERAQLMLFAAEGTTNVMEVAPIITEVQKLLGDLPAAQKPELTVRLARLMATTGQLDNALALCETMLEKNLADTQTDSVEFLKASILELKKDPAAETQLLALTQRAGKATQLRAWARLAAYYAAQKQEAQALEIFRKELVGLFETPEILPAYSWREVAYGLASLVPILPAQEAEKLSEWLKLHGLEQGKTPLL